MQQQPGSNIPGGGSIDPGGAEINFIFSSIAPGAAQIMATIAGIATIILGWFSIILEVYLRFDFGERYLSWIRLAIAGSIFSYFIFFAQLLSPGRRPISAPLFSLFALGYIIALVIHRRRIWLRYRHNIPWHSMSMGTSWLSYFSLPLAGENDWTLYRIYEPILCAGIGILLMVTRLDIFTGQLILIASFALFIKNNITYFSIRSRVLDLIDARIEALYYNEEAAQKPKDEVAGISVMKVVWPKLPEAPSGKDALQATLNETVGGTETPEPKIVTVAKPATLSTNLEQTIKDTLGEE